MIIYDVIDIFILIVGIIVLVYSLFLIFRCWNKWFLFLPLVLWAIHLTFFYGFVVYADLFNTSIDEIFSYPGLMYWWSTLQRFHGVTTMLFMTFLLATEIKYTFMKSGCSKE